MKRATLNIEDVYDGQLYQSHFTPGGFLSEPYNISLKLNTDGVAVFNSSKFGVWALFFLVNELPPSLRLVKAIFRNYIWQKTSIKKLSWSPTVTDIYLAKCYFLGSLSYDIWYQDHQWLKYISFCGDDIQTLM